MLRVNAINRQELLKCLTFNSKSLVIKTVSVPPAAYPRKGTNYQGEGNPISGGKVSLGEILTSLYFF